MKTISVVTILLLLTINTKAQTYHPLPTQNAYWTVYEFDEGVYDDKVYTVKGDTLINGLQYTKVYKLNDYPTIYDTVRSLHCLMRQDNQAKKIWFIRSYLGETSEKLGYDLSVAIGDTISLPAFDYGNVGDSIYVRFECEEAIINTGEYRKQYCFASIYSVANNVQQFIEGVCNVMSTFPNKFFLFDPSHQSSTPCVKIDNLYIWSLGADEYRCGFNFMNVKGPDKKYFQTFPNPASNFTNIKITSYSKNSSLCLYNAVGEKLDEIHLIPNTNEYILNISLFPSGIYLLELRTPTFITYNKLIVIN